MSINQVIREKRKEHGFTQEQVADYLGVSAPAVNKWESGASFPDTALLSPLARLLETDLNTLLCFQEGPSKQEIHAMITDLDTKIKAHGIDEGFAAAVRYVHQYPANGPMIHQIAMLLDTKLLMSGMKPEEKQAYEDRILALYKQASECEDSQTQVNSRFMLASKYMLRMEYEKAQNMLDLLPERNEIDKKKLQADLYIRQDRLEDAALLLERKLQMALFEILNLLTDLTDIELKEGNINNAAYIAEISASAVKLFDQWDYSAYIIPLQVAAARKDRDECLSVIKSILQALITPWDAQSSPLYSRIPASDEVSREQLQEMLSKKALPPLLSELEHNQKYAFLWPDKEFQQMIKHYRSLC